MGDLAGQELDEALERLGVAAGAGHEVERIARLDLLEVAHGDLEPAAVALDPAEHAHRVALVEPRAEQVDVVPDHAGHAPGAVGQLHRQERVAVSGVAALLALHGEGGVDERPLAQIGHIGVPGHQRTLYPAGGRRARRGAVPATADTRLPRMASDPATAAPLRPLRALRYDTGRGCASDDVVVPPYDVIAPADRDRYAARSEYSAVHLVLPDSTSRAGRLFYDWRQSGILVQDAEPALWWHVQDYVGPDGAEGSRSGFLSAVRLSDYSEGRVRPHEQTHASARAGQLELTRAVCRQPLARVRALRRSVQRPRATRCGRMRPGRRRWRCATTTARRTASGP